MTQHNQKIFRRILIGLGIICVFLLGSIIKVNVSPILFIVVAAFTIGLFLGYCLGAGKNFQFWKENNTKKK